MPKFVPRQRKHKVRSRTSNGSNGLPQPSDANRAEILPPSRAEKEDKRQRLREELRAARPKMGAKKQKRLDKYIVSGLLDPIDGVSDIMADGSLRQDTKLKKDENLELMKRLARAKIDTTLLKSSKTLGAVRESKREVLARALRERAAGLDVDANEKLLFQKERIDHGREDDDRHNDASSDEEPPLTGTADSAVPVPATIATVGSGLKRPLDIGEDGKPIIPRKKAKKAFRRVARPEDLAWDGAGSDEQSLVDGEDPAERSEGSKVLLSESQDDDETSISSPSSIGKSTTSSDDQDEADDSRKQRSSAFKAWANNQLNQALGFLPSADSISSTELTSAAQAKSRLEEEPLPRELMPTHGARQAFHVEVERTPGIMEARLALPVVAEEQKIVEAIQNNPVVVIWGATGSGKTTQIPQFLYEAGYGSKQGPTPGMIGITQPRRVAAVSMARRVGEELGKDFFKVAYKIRFEGTVNESTAIKFMTDGILLREAAEDITLRKYSAIIIDEAHERTIDTDILIGMMSRIVKLRQDLSREDSNTKPLKLVIMSATLKVSDFTENNSLFTIPPPLIQAEGRQHPVTVHWARRTTHDYSEEIYRKACKAHKRLPEGGILVFLTGQNEITHLSKMLERAFPEQKPGRGSDGPSVRISSHEAPLETEDMELGAKEDDLEDVSSDDEVELVGVDDANEDDDFDLGQSISSDTPMHVLPLYSLLPTREQLRVFETPPEGARLVVLATNVAETSLTIPGIRYVFDCGRSKERRYDHQTGVQSFETDWISKASASQRAGRAGRTGPGHCYRLYSSAVYERDFEEHAQPEILRTPIEGVVLQLSALNVPNIIHKFPFPTPPDQQRLAKAQKLLTYLGALSPSGQITDLGRAMSGLPLSPRFAKILLNGRDHSSLPYTIAVVAALSVPDIFVPEIHLDISQSRVVPGDAESKVFTNADRLQEDARDARRKAYNGAHRHLSQLGGPSDGLKLLAAVLAYSESANPEAYCEGHFLRPKALRETQMLRRQLHNLLRADPMTSLGPFKAHLPTPSSKQLRHLTHTLAAGYIDQLAILASAAPSPLPQDRKPKRAINVPYLPLFPSHTHTPSSDASALDPAVYIHPSSVLAHHHPSKLPQYIIYAHLQRSAAGTGKVRMLPLTPISAAQLSPLTQGTPLLTYSKPVKEPRELESGTREVWVVPSLRGPQGSLGWPLPARRVVQRKANGVWVMEP